MASETTLVVIKPDAIQRGLTGHVLTRIEQLKLHIIGAKAARVSRDLAEEHYKHLRHKDFFNDLLDHLTGKIHGTSYVLVFVFWGPDAIERVRQVTGATHPEKADPMSLRGSFGRMTAAGIMENIIHASADRTEADREIALWFRPEELLSLPIIAAGARG